MPCTLQLLWNRDTRLHRQDPRLCSCMMSAHNWHNVDRHAPSLKLGPPYCVCNLCQQARCATFRCVIPSVHPIDASAGTVGCSRPHCGVSLRRGCRSPDNASHCGAEERRPAGTPDDASRALLRGRAYLAAAACKRPCCAIGECPLRTASIVV